MKLAECRYGLSVLVAGLFAGTSIACWSDGSVIDKVYHPYVEQLEWELEWRMVYQDENPVTGVERGQSHRLGLGHAFGEYFFAEAYLIGQRSSQESFELEAYEVEALWQLSEQGEFALDYGLLFELEKERNADIWEYATVLLLEKEFNRFSATANLGVIYEWGDDIENEWETTLALQGRYRMSPRLEPALEMYMGENTLGAGPVLMGVERIGSAGANAFRWEAGVIFGLDSDTSDYTLRALLEYEF
ncbi:MAG: hypothetical protein V7746_10485 [Halioglobus sp.]